MAKAKKSTKASSAKKSGILADTSTNPIIDSATPNTKRSLKKVQTVRERAEKAGNAKPRRLHRAGSTAAKPFRFVGGVLAKLFRPFRFLLWPLKRRPIRFVGRILAKLLLLGYFRNSWRELRQVQWPTARETAKLTTAVFIFAIIFTLLISLVDFGLDKLFKALILN